MLSRSKRVLLAAALMVAAWYATMIGAWPREDRIPEPAPAVVIALSSTMRDDSTLAHAGRTRLDRAIVYAREHRAKLFVTRIRSENGVASDTAQWRQAVAGSVGGRFAVLRDPVLTTRTEALALRSEVPTTEPIAVVTSPLHSRRACATFERLGYRVTCVTSAQYEWWRLIIAVPYESAAFVKYKWNGWW